MRFKWFIPGIVWFIVSVVLLSLPGDDLPHVDFLNIPYFDKYVHFGMFFLLTFLFSVPLTFSSITKGAIKNWFVKIAVLVIIYGVAMEYVQKYCSSGRSFDLFDILFDSLGSLAGLVGVSWYYNKKIGPDGNQGRNQN